ncbi:hypothetical protein MMYC01_208840 [Madurella mycetomatis]|uniref:Uncharacterized protein n=1 Tax=Madurella mycetomatis TaxID=100816 RepID=A0A175VSL0_9PEZI|nr:hypothetical protein MMYC01_208840 [Madurella mycetomatis]
MHQSNLVYLLAAGAASAAWQPQQLLPGSGSMPLGGLLARQEQNPFCTIHTSCSDCFGEGYKICDIRGCFNPDIHQQCCVNSLLCVGRTNECCKAFGGPGITGTSGVPNVTASPTRTTSSATAYFTCRRTEPGEDCCQRYDVPLHWCSGEFPNFRCYNDKKQWCCTDGTVCDEEGCCEDLFVRPRDYPPLGSYGYISSLQHRGWLRFAHWSTDISCYWYHRCSGGYDAINLGCF